MGFGSYWQAETAGKLRTRIKNKSNFHRQDTKFAKKGENQLGFKEFLVFFFHCSWRTWRLGGEIGFCYRL
jgi:hypothetical protein